MDAFNIVDLLIIIIVSLSLIFGLMKGFLREIFSFIFFILAIMLASLFYSDLSNIFVKNDSNSINQEKIKIIHKQDKTTTDSTMKNINKNLEKTPSSIAKGIFKNKKKGRTVADFIAFLIIFFFILIIGSIVTYFIKKILVRGPMKSVDRILGAFFGLIRGILICSIIIYGVRKIEFKVKIVNNSFIVKILLNETIELMQGFLPQGDWKWIKRF